MHSSVFIPILAITVRIMVMVYLKIRKLLKVIRVIRVIRMVIVDVKIRMLLKAFIKVVFSTNYYQKNHLLNSILIPLLPSHYKRLHPQTNLLLYVTLIFPTFSPIFHYFYYYSKDFS